MVLSAGGGGGSKVAADQSNTRSNETFSFGRWRSPTVYSKIRANGDQFVSLNDGGELVAVATSPGQAGEFQIINNNRGQIRMKAPNGKFLQVRQSGSVTANSEPGGSWSDSDPSVFNIQVIKQMQGDSAMQFSWSTTSCKHLTGKWMTTVSFHQMD